jgi:hypothetical protein
MGCFLSRKQEYPPAKAPAELVAREGKYPPIGIKIPSQATLAKLHCRYFVKKSSFLAIFGNYAQPRQEFLGDFAIMTDRNTAGRR